MNRYVFILFCFMISSAYCFAKSEDINISQKDYNYITAATFFPLTIIKPDSKYVAEIISKDEVSGGFNVKIKILPDNIFVDYFIDTAGIILSAKATYQDKEFFSVSLDANKKKLFPTNILGNWSDNIEKIIFSGLKDFSVGKYLLEKKAGEQIAITILSVQAANTFELAIDDVIVQYLFDDGVKKIRIYTQKDDKKNIYGVLTLYDEEKNSKLNGMLLSYEYYDDRLESLVYFSPLKLNRIGVIYTKDKKPFAKVYASNGKLLQDEYYFKVKPSPYEYWKLESEK